MHIPQMLIIAGNGSNSGKTTLACRLISKFCQEVSLVSLKISPHDYQSSFQDNFEAGTATFGIMEEKDRYSTKDSARMLAAGARRSFFISAADESLKFVIPEILELVKESNYIICESGGLRQFVEPGLFLLVTNSIKKENSGVETDMKPGFRRLLVFEHTSITFDGSDFNPGIDRITVKDGKWRISNS